MVCAKCEKKLAKLATPEVWKDGSRHTEIGSGRSLAENKLLSKRPMKPEEFQKCRSCQSVVHQKGSKFCQSCAYKDGICAMCGRKILDTTAYKQSAK